MTNINIVMAFKDFFKGNNSWALNYIVSSMFVAIFYNFVSIPFDLLLFSEKFKFFDILIVWIPMYYLVKFLNNNRFS